MSSATVPLEAPVDPNSFLLLYTSLLAIGFIFTGIFLGRQMGGKERNNSIIVDTILALIGASGLGTGFIFLLLWARVWI